MQRRMREYGVKARMRLMVVGLESDSSYSNLLRPFGLMPCLKGHQVVVPLRVFRPSGKLYIPLHPEQTDALLSADSLRPGLERAPCRQFDRSFGRPSVHTTRSSHARFRRSCHMYIKHSEHFKCI